MFITLKKRLSYIRNKLVRLLEFETIIKTQQVISTLTISEAPTLIIERKTDETELIVSLTTFSKRIHSVHLVIETIARQTVLPNKIVLWLDEAEFKYNDIPLTLIAQVAKGLEIKFYPNIRSYKKLIPIMESSPEANIITIDDDILYPIDMIEQLVRDNRQYPDVIIGHRAHRIKASTKKNILPYLSWDLETSSDEPGYDIFLTSGAGTLFPAKCFNDKAFNSNVFLDICPNADDVWFKAMSIINEVKCKKVKDNRKYSDRFFTLPDDQDIGLYNTNISDAQNDSQIKSVFSLHNIDNKSLM